MSTTSFTATPSTEKADSEHTSYANLARKQIVAQGQVQGVGFRPFIYRLALEYGLTGHVCNTAQGVYIEVQGAEAALQSFAQDIQDKLPPLAQLSAFSQSPMAPQGQEENFIIIHSQGAEAGAHSVLISSDVAMCAQCEEDMLQEDNRRYMYPFTNCTNCGPRYTITHSIPYDRATTSMACFPLCAACQAEYDDPLNRRFHAQPNACPVCGPKLWYVEKDSAGYLPDTAWHTVAEQGKGQEALRALSLALQQGRIAAVKGLGGFHLACDALNEEVIARLRKYKSRPHKPFAVMVENIQSAHAFAHISPAEEALLCSKEKPIVLCKRKNILPSILAPDTDTIGLVLPYTPLHMALFQHLRKNAMAQYPLALVMTSGNAAGNPICLGNREAVANLCSVAEVFLLHDRDILVRNDDSVCAVHSIGEEEHTVFLRRARGYVPRPISLAIDGDAAPCVLAMGAELKNTLCLTRQGKAFVSQHVGDLQNLESLDFYRQVLSHTEMLLRVQGQVLVHDAHPDFLSTRVAEELAQERGIVKYPLQHHFAHAYAVLAEQESMPQPCLALSLDGTGYGLDGTIWGGELLYIDGATHSRLGRLSLFAMPGGEQAIREPWRMAIALAKGTDFEQELVQKYPMAPAVLEMLEKNIRSPLTSSVGRLFDAVSAALGLCDTTSHEGQAAIRLEYAQDKNLYTSGSIFDVSTLYNAVRKEGDLWQVGAQEIFVQTLRVHADQGVGAAAAFFHHALAANCAYMAHKASQEYAKPIQNMVLCGGVMQNTTFHSLLSMSLQKYGFTVLRAKDIPPNDGGISLGQAYYGHLRWQQEIMR